MKLSEAIRLGSLAIQKPLPGDVRFCAIGMACEAIGKRDLYIDEQNYKALFAAWPWIYNEGSWPAYHRIHKMFDDEVCSGKMTLEALCDQVRAWEQELESRGINVERVTMAAELTEPASQELEVNDARSQDPGRVTLLAKS